MKHDIKVDLDGKISNLDLKPSDALLPLYEAVVNSIQAIHERGNIRTGKIVVRIHRTYDVRGQSELNLDKSLPPITGFTIEDNGIGFNIENYDSFTTSDSTHKKNLGGKGLGHFIWLKAFEDVHIESVFEENNSRYLRDFIFTLNVNNKKIGEEILPTKQEIGTKIHLNGFKEKYRMETHAYKKSITIAEKIFYHCLSFFINHTAPEIIVIDKPKEDEHEDKTFLSSLYDEIKNTFTIEKLKIKDYEFIITHIRLYNSGKQSHHVVYCGNTRDVFQESIESKIGTSNQFDDKDGKFIYCGYVSGIYLDTHVNQGRTSFTIPNKRETNLYGERNLSENELSMNEISEIIVGQYVLSYLKDYLDKVNVSKKEMIEKYVSTINPSYRIILPYCDSILNEIKLGMTNEKLAGVLSRFKGILEDRVLKNSDELLGDKGKSILDIRSEVDKLLPSIGEFQKSELTGYVLYRYKLLQLLQKKLELTDSGEYSLEKEIHNLIFPQKFTSDQLPFGNHNLWVLDDRLAFHSYATSDMELNKISDSQSQSRPDIIIFNENEKFDGTASAVTILEFKRPDTMDKDILDQIYEYLEKLHNRKIKTASGRTINTTNETIYYCYAICDFNKYDSKIHLLAKRGDYKKLMGDLGYYTYNSQYNAHMEILSYDKLVPDAKLRNWIWFEQLGLKLNDI